jgi:glycosyltransferase involved in cell wall biosynthesis
MQQAKAMIYGGTAPASYTLSFIEALMMGLPIVAINNKMANIIYNFEFYECEDLLRQCDGIFCDSTEEMVGKTNELINNYQYAKDISERQRALATVLFGKKNIIKQWEEFLNGL